MQKNVLYANDNEEEYPDRVELPENSLTPWFPVKNNEFETAVMFCNSQSQSQQNRTIESMKILSREEKKRTWERKPKGCNLSFKDIDVR